MRNLDKSWSSNIIIINIKCQKVILINYLNRDLSEIIRP
jgi:hypothetical protein